MQHLDFDILKLNILNIAAISMQMLDFEKSITILVAITALVYNVLKIYAWIVERINKNKE